MPGQLTVVIIYTIVVELLTYRLINEVPYVLVGTLALFHLFLSLFLVLLDGLIKYCKAAWLIAGYNNSSKEAKEHNDVKALCRGVGHLLFAPAGTLIIPSAGGLFNAEWAILVGWIFFTITAIAFVTYANTGNRYRKT